MPNTDPDQNPSSGNSAKLPILSYCQPFATLLPIPNRLAWCAFACGMLSLAPGCLVFLIVEGRSVPRLAFNDNYLLLCPWLLLTTGATVLGTVGLRRSRHRYGRGEVPSILALIAGALSLLVFSLGLIQDRIVWDRYATGRGPFIYCANNLKHIAVACRMYADDNRGWLPTNLAQCLPYLTTSEPGRLRCRYGLDAEAPAGISRPTDPHNPTFWNYVYLGAGLRSPIATTVLLYENPANHPGQGMHVVYADTHVEWLSARDAAKLIASLPPRPTTLPSTRPRYCRAGRNERRWQRRQAQDNKRRSPGFTGAYESLLFCT